MLSSNYRHPIRHPLTIEGYRAVLGGDKDGKASWDERAARRACNALLGRPASDRPRSHTCDPEPTAGDWSAAARSLKARSDEGFARVPVLEAMMPKEREAVAA